MRWGGRRSASTSCGRCSGSSARRVAGVPSLSRAAGAVGAVGVWTGAVADKLQRDELGPLDGGLGDGLLLAEQALEDELAHARRARDRARSEAVDGSVPG